MRPANVVSTLRIGGRLVVNAYHSVEDLSQQGTWASFGHPNPQKSHIRRPKFLWEIPKDVNFEQISEYSILH